jgi:hypothetical protein
MMKIGNPVETEEINERGEQMGTAGEKVISSNGEE